MTGQNLCRGKPGKQACHHDNRDAENAKVIDLSDPKKDVWHDVDRRQNVHYCQRRHRHTRRYSDPRIPNQSPAKPKSGPDVNVVELTLRFVVKT